MLDSAYKNYSNMSLSALDAELSIELGTIEQYKDNSIRESAKFWGAVANRVRIESELRRREAKEDL